MFFLRCTDTCTIDQGHETAEKYPKRNVIKEIQRRVEICCFMLGLTLISRLSTKKKKK